MTARDCGLRHLGIGIVDEAAAACRDTIDSARRCDWDAQVATGDVARLAALMTDAGFDPVLPTVLVLPFNLFGNLAMPVELLPTARATGVDVLLLGYRTTEPARSLRDRYYRDCGFEGNWSQDSHAVIFHTKEWTSLAFRKSWLRSRLREHGYRVRISNFGSIGVAVHAVIPGYR